MNRILFLLLVSGCAPKLEPQDQFVADGKADSFSSKMKILSSIGYGDPAYRFKYTSSPIYRAFSFSGGNGDKVDLWVRSTAGDPVTWLLDSSYKVVAKNDDASSSVSDSHIQATLKKNDTFYVVMRDYDYGSHYFTVELDGTASGGCALQLAAGGSNATIDSYAQSLEDKNAGWDLTTRTLPTCLDLSSADVKSRVRELIRTGGFLDTTTQATAVATGGNAFVQLLDQSLRSYHDRAGADAHLDSLESSIKRPVINSPADYFEVRLSTSAEECSQSAAALVDTRTGIVYIVRQLLPC